MTDDVEARQLEAARQLAASRIFEVYCRECWDGTNAQTPEERRRHAVRRDVELFWDEEHEDGYVVSRWPAFTVTPTCPGAWVEDPEERDRLVEQNREARAHAQEAGYSVAAYVNAQYIHVPEACPFHEQHVADWPDDHEVDAVLARNNERRAFARALGVSRSA